MNESTKKIEQKIALNQQLIEDKKNKATLLLKEAEKLTRDNEHLSFSLGFLSENHSSANIDKKPIRSVLLDLIQDGETVTIDDAWDRVDKYGIETTKATINTTLYNLSNEGFLVRPSKGLYKKPD